MSRPLKKAGFKQGLYQQSATQLERLGTLRITQDGRKFRYAKAGATELAKGKMTIGVDGDAELENEAQTAKGASQGDTSIELLVTAGLTIVANEFQGGYLMINDADNEGICVEIDSNEAVAATGTALFVTLCDPLPTAIAATSEITIHRSPWWKTAVSTTEENFATGVPLITVTAGYFYWSQTGGMANVLMSGTPAKGTKLIVGATAGSVKAPSATTDTWLMGHVGIKLSDTGVSGEYQAVWLQID